VVAVVVYFEIAGENIIFVIVSNVKWMKTYLPPTTATTTTLYYIYSSAFYYDK
jgi:hypothetical protein